jgi:zinc/manganese transport system permease protein
LLAENPHGAQHLKDLLVGQILWSTWKSLVPVVLLYAVILTVWFKWHDRVGRKGFYVVFAFAVTASVQLVGVYLVFASLIIPALATTQLTGRVRLWAGYLLGALAFMAGIILSALFDLPTGAVIVWTMALLAVVMGFYWGYGKEH